MIVKLIKPITSLSKTLVFNTYTTKNVAASIANGSLSKQHSYMTRDAQRVF